MRENRSAEAYRPVTCLDVNGSRVRNGAPERGAYSLDQHMIFGPIGLEPAPRFCEHTHCSIRPIASRRVESIARGMSEASELIFRQRAPPAPSWLECIHECGAEGQSRQQRNMSVHEIPFAQVQKLPRPIIARVVFMAVSMYGIGFVGGGSGDGTGVGSGSGGGMGFGCGLGGCGMGMDTIPP